MENMKELNSQMDEYDMDMDEKIGKIGLRDLHVDHYTTERRFADSYVMLHPKKVKHEHTLIWFGGYFIQQGRELYSEGMHEDMF
jgi:hypothetical protein